MYKCLEDPNESFSVLEDLFLAPCILTILFLYRFMFIFIYTLERSTDR